MKKLIKYAYVIYAWAAMLFWPLSVFAYNGDDETTGFGTMASHMVQGPMTILMHFIDDACYVAGIVLLLVGFSKFMRYRRNPQETPISTPIVYFILGVLVILLPFSYYLVQAVS